jgi:hypothetical protein
MQFGTLNVFGVLICSGILSSNSLTLSFPLARFSTPLECDIVDLIAIPCGTWPDQPWSPRRINSNFSPATRRCSAAGYTSMVNPCVPPNVFLICSRLAKQRYDSLIGWGGACVRCLWRTFKLAAGPPLKNTRWLFCSSVPFFADVVEPMCASMSCGIPP